jgi:hypothetical protein
MTERTAGSVFKFVAKKQWVNEEPIERGGEK